MSPGAADAMAELTPLPPSERPPADLIEYQPLSAWAVASLAVSVLFALILAVTVVTAFSTHKPAFNHELLLLALAGFALSIAARVQIRRSEGTRTGLVLATAAWWISVLGGAGYGAYILASGRVLRSQSLEEANRWFDALRARKIETAYLLSIDPARRASLSPDDRAQIEAEFPGALQGFRNHELVRLFLRNGEDVHPESLGIRDWTYQPSGYHVVSSWRLICPEGIAPLSIVLVGTELKEAVTRQWHVLLSGESGFGEMRRTAYGRLILELRGSGMQTATNFINQMASAQRFSAQALTLPPAQRPKLAAAQVACGVVLGSVGTFTSPDVLGFPLPPNFFRSEAGLTAERAALFQRLWADGDLRPASPHGTAAPEAPEAWVSQTEVRVMTPAEVQVPDAPKGSNAAARLHFVADNPEFVAKAWELREAGKADPGKVELNSAPIMNGLPAPNWRLVALESNLEVIPTGPPGGMPGGPPGRGRPR